MSENVCASCGRSGHRAPRCPSRPKQAAAHALLDRAKAGDPIGPDAISDALHATGDLDVSQRRVVRVAAGEWDPWRGPAASPFSGLGVW